MQPSSRTRLETILCLVLLATTAAAVLHPTDWASKVPVDGRRLLFQPPWEAARPEGMNAPPQSSTAPETDRYYPWYVFLSNSARRHELPLWDPYEACGMPFFALWRTRCLSPFSAPFYFLPLAKALWLSLLLKLLVAGFAAFYTARRFGFAPPLALLAGIAFQLSGHVFGSLIAPASDVVPWFPILLLFSERLVIGQNRYWPLGALVLALMLLGGSPETVIALLLFCGLYLVVRLLGERANLTMLGATMALFSAVTVLALGLAAIQIAPFLEFVKHAAPRLWTGSPMPLHLSDTIACFLPHFFGAAGAELHRGTANISVHSLALFHVGLVQILLLPLWLALRRFAIAQQRRRIESLVGVALAMTILAFFASVFLRNVPYLGRISSDHLLAGNALALALLAVATADEWLALDPDEARLTIVRFAVLLPLLLVFALALLLLSHGEARNTAPALFRQLGVAAIFFVVLLAILTLTLLRPSPALMGYALSAATCAQLFLAFHANVPAQDKALVFPNTKFIQSLKDGGARVSGSAVLAQWPLAGNLIPQVYSASGVLLKRQAQFLARVAQDPLLLRRTGAPALLLTKQDIQGPFASVRPMLKIRRVFASGAILFDDLAMKPRAWMTYKKRNIDKFNPALLSSSLPPLVEGALPPNTAPARPAKATITADTPRDVKIHVEDTPPGLLVLSDTFYPGWKVTVDGTAAPLLAVDRLFRGVPLVQGAHNVEFTYDPRSLRTGLDISSVCVVILLAGMFRLLFHRRHT